MKSRISVPLAACLLALACVPSSVLAQRSGTVYSRGRVSACLEKSGVFPASQSAAQFDAVYKRLLPPTVIGQILILGYVPPPTGVKGDQYSARIDSADLFFFRSHVLARHGEQALVRTWIYGKGLPHTLPAAILLPKVPPTKAAADALHSVRGNVVVIWQYPFHFALSSERILDNCLR